MADNPKDFVSKRNEPISPREIAIMSLQLMDLMAKDQPRAAGGPGSGNFGHSGRPGEVGGSSSDPSSVPDGTVLAKSKLGTVEKATSFGTVRFKARKKSGELLGHYNSVAGAKEALERGLTPDVKGGFTEGRVRRQVEWKDTKIESKAPADDSKAKTQALESLRDEIRRTGPRYGGPEIEITNEPNGPVLAVRNFGQWEIPPDAEGDTEDYDWKEPTQETRQKLDSLAEKFSKQFGVSIKWSAEEKNWVTFYTESKKAGRVAGGPGSGNFGHAGRPGEIGGSAPGEGGGTAADAKRDQEVFAQSSKDYPPHNPTGADTRERFFDGKNYTPERQELHRAIIRKYLAGATRVEKPVATILGGGPASGKTSLVEAQGIGKENTVLVDVDKIRLDLPEQKEGVAAGDKHISAVTHEESSDIAKMLVVEAVKSGFNLVQDGTGDSSPDKLAQKIEVMRRGGHQIVGKYVTLPTELALQLAHERGLKTGRFVPETMLRLTHAAVSETFPEVARRGLFDYAELHDTTVFGDMKHVATVRGKEITIHNQALWETFLAKGKEDNARY